MNNKNEEQAYTCITPSENGAEWDCKRIEDQYLKRIQFVMASNRSQEVKEEEIKQLRMNSLRDPRRPDIFYSSKIYAEKRHRTAIRLDSLSDQEFMEIPYVLNWSTDSPDIWILPFKGDITTLAIDVIVNAANRTILGGSGVDGAIHAAAGEELRAECYQIREEKYPQGVPTGEAVITKGYKLPAKYVIHTPGPIWEDGEQGEPELLFNCYYNSLKLAMDKGLNIIAFPEISTGAYGYPKDKAKEVVISAISKFAKDFPAGVEEVILVEF